MVFEASPVSGVIDHLLVALRLGNLSIALGNGPDSHVFAVELVVGAGEERLPVVSCSGLLL